MNQAKLHKTDINVKEIVMVSFLLSLLIYSSYISVPSILGVPFTLQVLFVTIIGFLLRPSLAALTISIYIMLGTIGLPVFSGGRSGAGVIFGPTGGYIFGFLFAATIISFLTYNKKITIIKSFIVGMIGLTVIYFIGSLQLAIYLNTNYFKTLYSNITFLPFDTLKILIASIVCERLLKIKNSVY